MLIWLDLLVCLSWLRTLAFLTEILGMHVIRHDENDEPCKITCNGNYDSPWSKTMVR